MKKPGSQVKPVVPLAIIWKEAQAQRVGNVEVQE